jgi:hypothetical protein
MAKEKEKTYTFDMVWKMFAETDKQMAETDKKIKELTANVDKTTANIDSMQKEVGGIGESNGAMTEEMIYNVLEKDKTFAGIKFDDINKNIQIQTEKFETKTELDIIMINGDAVSLIEAKYKVEKKDIKELIKNKLPYFRQYYPKYNDYKILLGIGGMSFEDKALKFAKENGVGIIKIVGDKVEYHTEGIKVY